MNKNCNRIKNNLQIIEIVNNIKIRTSLVDTHIVSKRDIEPAICFENVLCPIATYFGVCLGKGFIVTFMTCNCQTIDMHKKKTGHQSFMIFDKNSVKSNLSKHFHGKNSMFVVLKDCFYLRHCITLWK